MKGKRKSQQLSRDLICPCCHGQLHRSGITHALQHHLGFWNHRRKIEREDLMTCRQAELNTNAFQWACDSCIAAGKAIDANPDNQQYCDTPPYLAYFDKTFACATCRKEFVFEKREQLFWYEELRFWVQSQPKNCATCRKKIRHKRNLNTELSLLLKSPEVLTAAGATRIAEIYEETGKPEKRKEYIRLAEKLLKKGRGGS